jgi:rRNA-processing protein FCF1
MKKAILDTSFILTCVKQKIDFLDEIRFMGIEVLIPVEVLEEIEKIARFGKRLGFRENAGLALKILGKSDKNSKNKFKKIKLDTADVDKGMLNFAEKNKDVIIATLDRELKKKIKKPKLVIRGKKKLEII